jgi:threonine dehydratase
VRGVVLVDDDSLRDAVHYLYRQCRLVVEPSGAATTAAVRTGALRPSGPTVLIVSGGNVDPALLED